MRINGVSHHLVARQAENVALEENLFAKKDFLKNRGSNRLLAPACRQAGSGKRRLVLRTFGKFYLILNQIRISVGGI